MLRVRELSKSFGDKRVLQSLSFAFPERAVTAITGPSGVGKTTLVNLLLGLTEPDSGEILGREGLRLAAVFQEDRLIEHYTALENVRLITGGGISEAEIRRALAAVGLEPGDRRRVSKYSGGMKRRVAIVRAALAAPELLILDEPFKGLDEDTRAVCAGYILNACPNATILLITHEPEELRLMRPAAVLELRAEGDR